MDTILVLLCLVSTVYPYLPGSLHCHWGNHTSYNNPRGSVATRKNMGWYHYINPISLEHSKGKHYKTACKFHGMYCTYTRADSRFAPSQWETALLCNDVSHWLGASLESALYTNASWTKKNCEYHSNAVKHEAIPYCINSATNIFPYCVSIPCNITEHTNNIEKTYVAH